ncbi:hypothetical protein FDA33_14710 [Clostridium botulinum]|nr:hypothetical protein [Clostridium botulinum]NFI18606.1 hypothetical protein [Clostridium botulinum]NFN52784.1 hypothetical protein [Clostridium botulinum]
MVPKTGHFEKSVSFIGTFLCIIRTIKKLDVIERRVVNNSITLEDKKIFKLINCTIINSNFKNMVSYFCELLNVSRSGYYNYLSTIEKEKLI